MAQDRKPDVIIRIGNTKVEALILEVNDKEVKYKKYGDKEGPTFTIGKENIMSILYGNGDVENMASGAEIYFDKGNSAAPQLYQQRPNSGPATRYLPGNPKEFSNEQLKFNEKFCYGKSVRYRRMGFTGLIAGSLLTIGGIILINDATRNYNYYGGSSYYGQDESKVAAGSLCLLTGLGAGITLTIIGFSKAKSYAKKSRMNGNELRKRDLSSLILKPAFNAQSRTASMGLAMSF